MRYGLVALLALAACSDDSAPPFVMPDAAAGDSQRPVGRGMSCEFAPCQTDLVCATTTDAQRCLPECEIGDGTCLPDELCTALAEGQVCTPLAEVPAYVVMPSYDVANLHGNAVGIELDPTREVLDVVVAADEVLSLLDTGAELGEMRPNIHYDVFAQGGVPEDEEDKVNVFVMRSLRVEAGGTIMLGGRRPTVLLVGESVVIEGTIAGTEVGGVSGGARPVEAAAGAQGNGLGGGFFQAGMGGGGATHCSLGGIGGGMSLDPAVPEAYGDEDCQPLQGGSSGAGTGERSGGGGAALQISAGTLTVASGGLIDVSGYDSVDDGGGPGGGGGSGGALLLQAETIEIVGGVNADGGNGGLGSEEANVGGAGSNFMEAMAGAGTIDGGGGGGFGWMRLEANTTTTDLAAISPALDSMCGSEAGLSPAVDAAPPPPACDYPAEPEVFTERCDLCNRRFCCAELTACEEDETCSACRASNDAGGSCTNEMEPLTPAFNSCIRQFCFQSCGDLIVTFTR